MQMACGAMSKKTGGPAFPRTQWPNETGMTLRDYFAAKAMQALVQGNYFDVTAKQAYMMADAMLKAREA
jgi:hypothetical protein